MSTTPTTAPSVEQELREQLARALAQLALEQETRTREHAFHAREHEFHEREREFYRRERTLLARERTLLAREREQLERERVDLLELLAQADRAAEHRQALADVSEKLDRLLCSGSVGARNEKLAKARASKRIDGLAAAMATPTTPVVAFAVRNGMADIARHAMVIRAATKKRKLSELQWADQKRKPRRARLQIATRSGGGARDRDPADQDGADEDS